MARVRRARVCSERAFILVGVGPLRSAKAARMDAHARAGRPHSRRDHPARRPAREDQAREGRRVCIDLIREIRAIKGVAGVHVMAYRQEEAVAEVITESGVLRRAACRGIPIAQRNDLQLERAAS